MTTTTIREIRHDTTTVLSWVASRETDEVHGHHGPVALLSPVGRLARVARPDFAGRLKEIYGKSKAEVTGTDLIAATEFLTFDQRQAGLANATGLRVPAL